MCKLNVVDQASDPLFLLLVMKQMKICLKWLYKCLKTVVKLKSLLKKVERSEILKIF